MTQPNRLKSIVRLLSAGAIGSLLHSFAHAARSVSQFGVTWTFDADYPTGQFANGDWWVVGPITLVSISPETVLQDGETLHGSMMNPRPNQPQAFDSRISDNPFESSANIARRLPLTIPAGTSILSSESVAGKTTGKKPQLKTIAVLTVLAEAPAPGSFRPPYAGADKTIRWNVSDLDFSRVRTLPRPRSTPSLSKVERSVARPLIELRSNWTGNFLKPAQNSPGYGREMSHLVADALLTVNLDYSPEQKRKTIIGLVQWGIDIYGAAREGMTWGNDGGHNHGRKPVLLFAGALLQDDAMLAYADASRHFIFQEDQQTWFVGLPDIGRRHQAADGRKRLSYSIDMIGLAEWGEKHTGAPERDGSNWDAKYRDVCGASMAGTLLAMRLMGLEEAWNWPAAFAYIERFHEQEAPRAGRSPNRIQPFVRDLWDAAPRQLPKRTASASTTSIRPRSARPHRTFAHRAFRPPLAAVAHRLPPTLSNLKSFSVN